MKNCCFIIPYFGTLPNYFQLFLNSCACNKDFNWLVFTDDAGIYIYPENVTRIEMTFGQLKALIQSKFDFPVCLDAPYKLCDYKPAYGYIFESYLTDYRFWGHCDVDTIIGDLNKFLSNDFMEQYDKIFCLGHMTIYKNTIENNRIFMSTFKGELLYKEVFQTPEIKTFDEEWRDERNINQIFLANKKKVYQNDHSLNFSTYFTNFYRTIYTGKEISPEGRGFVVESYRRAVYLWNKGKVERYFKDALHNMVREEFLYIHLQKRKMRFNPKVLNSNIISIVPNEFIPFGKNDVSVTDLSKVKTHSDASDYYYDIIVEKYQSMKKRVKNYLRCLIRK